MKPTIKDDARSELTRLLSRHLPGASNRGLRAKIRDAAERDGADGVRGVCRVVALTPIGRAKLDFIVQHLLGLAGR